MKKKKKWRENGRKKHCFTTDIIRSFACCLRWWIQTKMCNTTAGLSQSWETQKLRNQNSIRWKCDCSALTKCSPKLLLNGSWNCTLLWAHDACPYYYYYYLFLFHFFFWNIFILYSKSNQLLMYVLFLKKTPSKNRICSYKGVSSISNT